MNNVLSIQLKQKEADQLEELCNKTERTPAWHLREALSRYLAEETKQEACDCSNTAPN